MGDRDYSGTKIHMPLKQKEVFWKYGIQRVVTNFYNWLLPKTDGILARLFLKPPIPGNITSKAK